MPQTRQLLVLLDDYVAQRAAAAGKPRSEVRFQQRELREAFGWGDYQLRRHLARLVELEYVLVHRTGRGNQRQYELLYDGEGRQGRPFLLGLTDVAQLTTTNENGRNDGPDGRNDAHSMPIRSAFDAHSMGSKNGASAMRRRRFGPNGAKLGQNAQKAPQGLT